MDLSVLVLAVGTQFPDLIDKPLGLSLHILPGGRTLAHSLLFAIPAIMVGVSWFRRRGFDRAGDAFAIGYLSHLAADALKPVLLGGVSEMTFLVWPLLGVPPTSYEEGIIHLFLHIELTPYLAFQLLLTAAAGVLWANDGYPGLRILSCR